MKFFVDTANVEDIKKANDMGVICGVTTNPSLIAKEGRDFNEAIKLVSDHMCIFLDASSTAYTLGMKLSGFTELTVITNGINLALELKDIPGVTFMSWVLSL